VANVDSTYSWRTASVALLSFSSGLPLGLVWVAAHWLDMPIYVQNLVTLIGIGIAGLSLRVARAVDARNRGRAIVRRALRANGAIVIARGADAAMALANRFAPEHLVVEREELARRPIVAGAIFVGAYTAQAAGDYATGSNHVLPTAGAARCRGGLSAADFVRVMAVQRVTRAGLAQLAPVVLPLARTEGLEGHAESIEVRLR